MDRVAGLTQILEINPKDSFARYGLALELARQERTDEAFEQFRILLENDPEYTAGYFMSAQTLATAGHTAEAIERLRAGIACAQRKGDQHAANEMHLLLDELDR